MNLRTCPLCDWQTVAEDAESADAAAMHHLESHHDALASLWATDDGADPDDGDDDVLEA